MVANRLTVPESRRKHNGHVSRRKPKPAEKCTAGIEVRLNLRDRQEMREILKNLPNIRIPPRNYEIKSIIGHTTMTPGPLQSSPLSPAVFPYAHRGGGSIGKATRPRLRTDNCINSRKRLYIPFTLVDDCNDVYTGAESAKRHKRRERNLT